MFYLSPLMIPVPSPLRPDPLLHINPAALFMHALKETCALHCLLALHIAGPLPVTQQTVMDITGFEDAAVRKGLQKLLVLGLAQCTGDKHHTAWRLTSGAVNLPLPLDRLLSIPASMESPIPQEEELIPITINSQYSYSSSDPGAAPLDTDDTSDTNDDDTSNDANDANDAKHSNSAKMRSPLPPPAVAQSASPAIAPAPAQPATPPAFMPFASPSAPPDAPSAATLAQSLPNIPPRIRSHPFPSVQSVDQALSPSLPTSPPHPEPPTLRAHFYAAFEAANVWLQLRRPLADALLAEDGPGWLRQSLGWICYAARRLPHVQRGAVLYISLRDRLPCDSAYLPPADMPFPAALAWALRGGEDEEPEFARDDVDPPGASPPAPEPETPEAALWRAVLDRLSLELPSGLLQARLLDARLLSLTAGACVIGAPTPQSRDWLANRLSAVLARALKDLTGRDLEVQIQTIEPIA